MPKNKLLLFESNEAPVESYAQLINALSGHELADIEALLDELKSMTFIEDEEILYNKLPMAVFYKQLPAVYDADVLVKVVIMQQGDGLILVVPEEVVSTYQDLKDNPGDIVQKNNDISLYAEVYNLNSEDDKLHELIKETYLNAGNGIKPFDLTDDLAREEEEDEGEEGDRDDVDFDMGADDEPEDEGFDDIEDDFADLDDFVANESAYKKFKKHGSYLENLESRLYEKANETMRKLVKTKHFENTLVVEVDNKNIYNAYSRVPAFAKRLLTNFGEAIRTNGRTQLVDSFAKDGKRYFVIAEDVANNYWYVINEDMEKLDEEKGDYIRPDLDGVARLRRSSVRKESRSIVPYKKGRKIVFVNKKIK